MQTDAADKIEAHPVQSREDLIAALQAVGAEVSEAGEIEQVFFSPLGQVLKVDGVEIQVFEYPDENLRQSESSTISEDGSSIGTTMVTWIDQPNFWAQGKIIVLYLGIDPDVRGLLDSALGTSLTSHP